MVGSMLFDFNTEFDAATPNPDQLAQRFRRLLGRPDVLVLCAGSVGDDAAGFAFLTLRPTPYHDGPLAQLEELYVRPAARNRGVGTALLTAAFDQLRALTAAEMLINVDEIDTGARRFYERHGFVNIEPGESYRMLCYLRVL